MAIKGPQQGQQQQQPKEKLRSVGRWYIGETLGKGGYSWVKKGYDKKTGKSVALKFMAKADQSWAEEQTRQVITEIESLKQIRHANVMKLYAYNLNAKYPTKAREKMEAILLVLEYAPGGELFDILYYTSALDEVIGRTYFRQMIFGLEACHKAGVCHRDLKPQNLLLDARFNLKITDFGLSKVFESDEEQKMKTTYVGTRGYQAPELLLNQEYDLKCDVFSAGVVLFILLNGYPPFEQAHRKDRWFNPLTKGDTRKFWKLHRGCPVSSDPAVQNLLERMLAFDPAQRASIDEIKEHEWFNGKILEGKELVQQLRVRHRKMEQKRRQDAKKLEDLQQSITRRSIQDDLAVAQAPPLFPEEEVEGALDIYTTAQWQDLFGTLFDVVGSRLYGSPEYYPKESRLVASVKTAAQDPKDPFNSGILKFEIRAWRSREFESKAPADVPSETQDVLVIRFRRMEGSAIDYRSMVKEIVKVGGNVLTGLPDWALQLQEQNDDALLAEQEEEDDYGALLDEDPAAFLEVEAA